MSYRTQNVIALVAVALVFLLNAAL